MTVGCTYDAVKETLLKRADVPHAVLTSSQLAAPVNDDLQPSASADLPKSVSPTPPEASPPAAGPSTMTAGLFGGADLAAEIDGGGLRRSSRSGLCLSAFDLHKSGLSSAAFRRRFRRSRSHQVIIIIIIIIIPERYL